MCSHLAQLVYSQTIPIAYFFGHQSPGENVKLYKMLVTTLAEQCTRRMAQNRLGAPRNPNPNPYSFQRRTVA